MLQKMCRTSSARPQCTTIFLSTGTVSSSVCTLDTTARNTSTTSSSPNSCRYIGCLLCFHFFVSLFLSRLTLFTLFAHCLAMSFFRSCSWSMHARHLPKRTKARMVSSLPWTSVTLCPLSDTTCSPLLWRRTLSR